MAKTVLPTNPDGCEVCGVGPGSPPSTGYRKRHARKGSEPCAAAKESNRLYGQLWKSRGDNRDRFMQWMRAYNQQPDEQARHRERQRRYRAEGKEAARARERYASDPEFREDKKARARGRYPPHCQAPAWAQRDGGWLCSYCNVDVGETYDVDHVVPTSRGGSDELDNLVLACPTCNRSKGDRTVEEWRAWLAAQDQVL